MDTSSYQGCLFRWDDVEMIVSNGCTLHSDGEVGGVEVTLASQGVPNASMQTRDDIECVNGSFGGTAESVCTRRVNNLSPVEVSDEESESSSFSSESSSSMKSYLQLAIPTGFVANYLENDTAFDDDTQGYEIDYLGWFQKRTSYRFKDSQEISYQPKSRALFRGARRSRVSIHSRMEWWHHQLSKPIRAITSGRRSMRSPCSDCLGRTVVDTVFAQPSFSDSGADWADFSCHQSNEEAVLGHGNRTAATDLGKDFDTWSEYVGSSKRNATCQHFEVKESPWSLGELPADKFGARRSQEVGRRKVSNGAWSERDYPLEEATDCCPTPSHIVVVDFDARTLITHQGTDEDSKSEDESADHIIDWDLG